MKLSITLSLALAGACSAFALAPGATTRTTASVVGAFDKPAAFVQQQRHHPSSTTSLSAAAASASSSDAIQTREVVPSAALIFP